MTESDTEKILILMQRLHRLRVTKRHPDSMPGREFLMLKQIKHLEDSGQVQTVSSLSERLAISKPAVSQVINILEEKGYVYREVSAEDRRHVHVFLTDAGKGFLKNELQKHFEHVSRVLVQLGEKDTAELLRLMERLCTLIDAEHASWE